MKLESYFPKKPFAQKHLLTLQDWTTDEIYQALSLATSLKFKQRNGIPHELLKGKTLGMIFTKSSTRTRVSFEVGIQQLGGRALFLSDRDIQTGPRRTHRRYRQGAQPFHRRHHDSHICSGRRRSVWPSTAAYR